MRRWLIFVALVVPSNLYADCRVGVAQIDVTPDYPVRLHGFGGRRAESDGVWQHIRASAVAIDDVLLIAVDNLGVPASMTAEIARRLNLPPERLAISATHTHTAPMLNGVAPTIFGTAIPPDHQTHIDRYTREFTDRLVEVGKAALADRRPARLSWGVGTVGFAINRRMKDGPVDHDLPILAVHGLDDKLRAVVVGYACHCVTMTNNRIGGDWAGCAREAIESAHPGAIALITIGCGADQNPDTRAQNDQADVAIAQGRAIAGEVDRLLKQYLAPIRGPITASRKTVEHEFIVPSRAQFEEAAKRADAVGHHARVQLARLDKGEALTSRIDYPITTWQFSNDLAMIFLPGEVVVDYSKRLKRELDGRRLWLTAYSNDSPCYIPSERVLKEGGYEGGGAMIYYDKPGPLKTGLEVKIVEAVQQLVGKAFAAPFDPRKVDPLPPSPQQARAAIHVADRFMVDLVAAEPLIHSPVAIAFGPDGRLWVAEMVDYPSGVRGDGQPGGRIRVLSDRDDLGRYRTSTVFLDKIPFPTGVTVWRDGVLVCAAPDILYAKDTDGDGKAGFGTENFQARVNSLEYGLDGWIYGSCGLYGGTIKSFSGAELKLGNRDFRIKPDTGEIEPASGRTQQGRVRDDWDNWFGCDNSNLAWHYPLPDHYLRRNPSATAATTARTVSAEAEPNRVLPAARNLQLFALTGPPGQATAACGVGIYRDDLLGADLKDNLFTCEPVNLLVHRQAVAPAGASFAGRRAAGEESREFLASTDPWFRPVQVRTGPDGCLYVVDMARYVIEHPRWIPPGELAKVDVRAGGNLGRIYRVRPANASPRAIPRLDRMPAPELASALETPSGTVRDLAMQLILWRADSLAIPGLEKLAAAERAETRVQALATLEALGALRSERVRQAISDADWRVRRFGVRLAERFIAELGPDLTRLVDDPSPHVRLQLALTLGEWKDPRGGETLGRLASDDPIVVSAALSSLNSNNLRSFIEVALGPVRPADAATICTAINLAMVLDDRDSLTAAVRQALTTSPAAGASREWRHAIAAGTLEALARSRRPVDSLFDSGTRRLLDTQIEVARRDAGDSSASLAVRLAAIAVLGWRERDCDLDLAVVADLLSSRQPPEIQAAAVDVSARIGDSRAPRLLLAAWPEAAPALKSRILDSLLARPGGAAALLDGIERQTIPARFVDATRRQRLLASRDPAIRAHAAKLFESSGSGDRVAVVREFESVSQMIGDPGRGQSIFAQRCATCHRLNGVGHSVGPDLGAVTNKSAGYLLQEILDPNRALDARYVEYVATTKAGKSIRGLVAAETATSVTLRGPDAKDETILRADIETLESTGRSLMPEGFEKDLSRQDLADVMAYVAGGK